MDVKIVRDNRVAPGGEGIVEMPGELLFVVSAAGVTQEGADSLETCWHWFISRGIWRYQQGGGAPIQTTYYRVGLDPGIAARVRTIPGESHCYLSPEHFTRGSTNGLQMAARSSIRRGWRYYAQSEVPATRRAS